MLLRFGEWLLMQLAEADDEDEDETMGDALRLLLSILMFFTSTHDCSW